MVNLLNIVICHINEFPHADEDLNNSMGDKFTHISGEQWTSSAQLSLIKWFMMECPVILRMLTITGGN